MISASRKSEKQPVLSVTDTCERPRVHLFVLSPTEKPEKQARRKNGLYGLIPCCIPVLFCIIMYREFEKERFPIERLCPTLMTWFLYLATGVLLAVSAAASPEKTKKALKKAQNTFVNILPPLTAMLLLVSISVAMLPQKVIASLIGEESGFFGQVLASLIGSLTLMPGFVAFPMAKVLLEHGAGVAQIAVFVSTLMMVGAATAPLEASFFGWKATLLRNGMAYFWSFGIGYTVWLAVRIWI